MARGRFGSYTPEARMNELLRLVNTVPRIIPKRIGEVTGMCPAIVYAHTDDELYKLFMGDPDDLLKVFSHQEIAKTETPTDNRRISAVTLLTESGIYLAVDQDRTKRQCGLEAVQSSLEHEFDEVFIGGFSEYPDSTEGAETMCTTGLIRMASKYVSLAQNNNFDSSQTELALGMCISQLAIGMPMTDQDIIYLVKP